MDDFDNLLIGRNFLDQISTDSRLLHPSHQILDDGQSHIGLQQGQAHLPQSCRHIRVGQLGLAAKAAKDAFQSLTQARKHAKPSHAI